MYETSKDTIDLTWDERKAKYLDVINNEYRGRTARFERNGHIYYAEFDRSSVRKHIYGDDRSSPKGRKALIKAGADGDVFDLVENSQYRRSKTNKKDNTNADYFDYFVKTVQIDGKVFDLIADVEKNYHVDGGYLYTLALRDNKRIEASPALENSNENSIKNAGNTSKIEDPQGFDAISPEPTSKTNLEKSSKFTISNSNENVKEKTIGLNTNANTYGEDIKFQGTSTEKTDVVEKATESDIGPVGKPKAVSSERKAAENLVMR